MTAKLFLGLYFLNLFLSATAINIVVFLPGTTDDERKVLNRLAQELAFRNHHVCAFRAIIIPEQKFLVQPRLHDVRELKLNTNVSRDLYEPVKNLGNDQAIWNVDYDSSDRYMIPIWTAHASACETILDSDLMDRLKDELYDVAVVYAGNPCHLGIVHALAMPFIYYDLQGYTDEVVMASSSPWIPSLPLSTRPVLQNGFTFPSRLQQLWDYAIEYSAFANINLLMETFSKRWVTVDGPTSELFQQTRDFKKRIPNFPNVNEIKKTASAFFVNSDRVLEIDGRPEVPNVVYVGGLHIEFPRPMFPPYNTTNALSKDGVILFSFGTVVNATQMPTRMKRAFLKAFSRFPHYRIYWRIGSLSLDDDISQSEIPKNINLTQYIPQNDLLAADETALLISNGGANSVMEAVNYGVPVLGIPLYGVNYDNLKKLESKGAAIILQKDNITAQSIYEAMRKLLKEDEYFNQAQKLSRTYKDKQTSALETAIHWVEYVGRHHGAKRKSLKSARQLYFFEYLMLDAAALVLAGVWMAWKMISAAWSLIRKGIRKCKDEKKCDGGGSESEKPIGPKSEVNGDQKSKHVEKSQNGRRKTENGKTGAKKMD